MIYASNTRQATKLARALEKSLQAKGISLAHGQALDTLARMQGLEDWNAWSAVLKSGEGASPRQAPQAYPDITDVDLYAAHCVIFGGQCYNIEWREEEALKFVGRKDLAGYAEQKDETALQLHYEDDGLVWDESLTVEQLTELTWDPAQRCFVSKDGETFKFALSLDFADCFESKASPEPKKAHAEPVAVSEVYQLYQAPRLGHPGECLIAARSLSEAQAQMVGLQDAGVVDIHQISEMSEDSRGPFLVEANSGYYNEFDSLNQAVNVAKNLLAADDELDETRVVTTSGYVLIVFEAQPKD